MKQMFVLTDTCMAHVGLFFKFLIFHNPLGKQRRKLIKKIYGTVGKKKSFIYMFRMKLRPSLSAVTSWTSCSF